MLFFLVEITGPILITVTLLQSMHGALLGELNPQMFVLVPDDVCNYTSRRGACQQFFENFLQQKIPAGRVPGGDREAEKRSF